LALSNEKEKIIRQIFELGNLFKQSMRKNFADEEMTMPQGMVISILKRNGQMMKMTDLSRQLSLTNSTVSGIVDRLEKQKLVERVRSEEDRRIVYVKVSPKYDEMHQEVHKKLEKSFEELMDMGSPEEIQKITEGLSALKRMMDLYNK
jgi:DNA-binding MarR family transcriptional regulator